MQTSHYLQLDAGSFDNIIELRRGSAGLSDSFIVDVPRKAVASLWIDIIPMQTASEASVVIAPVPPRELPSPRNGRFSFRDLMSVLDASGIAAFDHQRQLRDSELRQRHERGEVSSLYFYRCLARMTQEQLATRAHSRQAFISQLEKRRRPLTWKQATKLAAALGVRPQQLLEHA